MRKGEVSSAEVLEAALTAIEQVNPRLNAVIEVFRAQAEQAVERGLLRR